MARTLLAASQIAIPQLSAALQEHELLQTLKSQEAERLIIEDGIEQQCLEAGMDAYIGKDCSSEQLNQLLKKHTPRLTT